MTRKLDDLVARGVNPSRHGWQSLLLENYKQIINARGLLWTWKDIAEALDIPQEKKGDLGKAFRRINAGIRTGKVMVPKAGKTTANAGLHSARIRTTNDEEQPVKEKPAFDFEAARIDRKR
ncbi:MAG: hypothetical protein ACYCY0_04510 [Acidithiobacillus ferrivorans]